MEAERPFLLNPFVSTVSLPYPNTIPDGEAMLTGWGSIGRTRVHEKPGNLQAAVLPIIDYDVCKRAIARSLKLKEKNPLHPTNICTGPLNGSLSACKVLFNNIERTIATVNRAPFPASFNILHSNRRNFNLLELSNSRVLALLTRFDLPSV